MDLNLHRWPGNGARVLLLHGLSSSGRGWWRLGPDLAALGLDVSAPDLRGHGRSGRGDGYAVSSYRDDVLAVGSDWDVVIGHSLGGMVTVACQDANASFGLALVLVDPALRVVASEELLTSLLSEFDTATAESLMAAQPRWASGDVEAKVEALSMVAPGVVEQTFDSLVAEDGWDVVAGLTVPTLIIGADPLGGGALVSELDGRRAERNRMVRYVAITGAGHSPHRDSYDEFLAVVKGFLERLGLVGRRY